MEGLSLLYKIDTSSVSKIRTYVNQFRGRHYIKEAYQKLAWAALVFNENITAYKYYMSQVELQGYALLDDDKQALKEAEKNKIPDPLLLNARLLFDGGYYQKALTVLTKNAYRYMDNDESNLEFNYRLARVNQVLKNYPEAIKYFSHTIDKGKDTNSYYPCNAALQLGLIYEDQLMYDRAIDNYKRCLNMKPSEYKNSLHQKAKTGLNRIDQKENSKK
jgi:tetratricopeptide (TPR) repeat protein